VTARHQRLTVTERTAGARLDRFLAEPLGSRAQAQSAIDAGRVSVNGRSRPKRHVLETGDIVEIAARETVSGEVPAADARFGIAYEDEYLLVVDKPAGVVVHPARGHAAGTLAQALVGRAAGGEEPGRAGIVHRLDRDTSGLLVVAKSEAVHRTLKTLLATRRLHRIYIALVEGHPSARSGTIDAPIGRDRRERLKISIDTDQPRAARTHFEVERLLPDTALLRVELETGRTHQIRVHMAAIGHPVCGDRLYGRPGCYGADRQFLHAHRLSFPHPVRGDLIDVSSPLPADLARALVRAGG
jgi:23S rRNA pseudouridine1911/1915/1917 synthase